MELSHKFDAWSHDPSKLQSTPSLLLASSVFSLPYTSPMSASGYGGFSFPDISLSGQHSGFQPHSHRLDPRPAAHFSSGSHGIDDGSLHALKEEIRHMSAQLIVAERDLAIQK